MMTMNFALSDIPFMALDEARAKIAELAGEASELEKVVRFFAIRTFGALQPNTTQVYLAWVVGDLREAMGGRRYR